MPGDRVAGVGRLLSLVGLGVLTRLVPLELVREVVDQSERTEQRRRALPSWLGVYFVLALCLLRSRSYGSVIQAMIPVGVLSRLRGLQWSVPSTSALSKLRDRVGALPLELLFRRLAGSWPTRTRSWSHAFGLLVCGWDGAEFLLADNDNLASRFPRHRGRKNSGRKNSGRGKKACRDVGVPKARVLLLVACGTRRVIDAVIGSLGKGEDEVSLAHRLACSLRAGMLVLADRNFLGYRLWVAARSRGAHLLWRAKSDKPLLPVQQVLWDGSYLSTLYDPADAGAFRRNVARNRRRGNRSPRPRPIKGIRVRVIEALITVTVNGVTRTERYRLVTSLLDPDLAPADQLVALYARRWVVETGIREIKTVLLAGQPLRGTTAIRARQELWAALVIYQALRLLICHAAIAANLDPAQISFTAARDAAERGLTLPPDHLETISQDLSGQLITQHTSHRTFPRARKNTLSRYPHRTSTWPLTSGKASYQAAVTPPATTPPTPQPPSTTAQPRAA